MLIVSFVFLAKLLEIHKDQALYESLVISLEYCNLFMREPAFITMSLLIWSENLGRYSCWIHVSVIYTEVIADPSLSGPEKL